MKQNIDLDYDSDLDGDAEGFGISNTAITEPQGSKLGVT